MITQIVQTVWIENRKGKEYTVKIPMVKKDYPHSPTLLKISISMNMLWLQIYCKSINCMTTIFINAFCGPIAHV